jgi:hypothetical protein
VSDLILFYPLGKLPLKLGQNFLRLIKRVFPNSQYSPTLLSQHSSHFAITSFVPCDLRLPEIAPRLGHPTVPSATVPETAVHKYGQAVAAKNEVWFARQLLMPLPTSYSM